MAFPPANAVTSLARRILLAHRRYAERDQIKRPFGAVLPRCRATIALRDDCQAFAA